MKINVNSTKLRPRLRFGDDDDDDEDDVDRNEEESLPKINMPLYEKAKTFGQSADDHKKVHEILRQLNVYVSNQQRNIVQNSNEASVINEVMYKNSVSQTFLFNASMSPLTTIPDFQLSRILRGSHTTLTRTRYLFV